MPIVPLRDLGKIGVSTDQDPFNLPPTAFTMACNARFEDNAISRGPVFRKAGPLTTNGYPRHVVSYIQGSGYPTVLVANDDGTVLDWSASGLTSSTESSRTASGWTASSYSQPYTSTVLNNIVYLNRPDRVPWYMTTGGTQFTSLSNWDSTWRCNSLRSLSGVLVAINVTKGATNYPTMIKTSDYTTYGSVPGSWVASTTNSATENVLTDLQEPLIDGWALKDRMILYSANETWLMEPRYDNLMFNYRRIWRDRGVISQNCVIEHDSIHYVFGTNDIWVHDGFQPQSIAAGITRDFIYDNMVKTQANQFFVSHNPRNTEIMFCYLSSDPYCAFPVSATLGYPGCNRAAVYNYRVKTWYFYDLPYVTATGFGPPVGGLTYTGASGTTFDSIAGAYSSFSDATKLALMTVGPAKTGTYGSLTAAVRSFERVNSVAANGLIDTVATAPVYIENRYIDMDAVGAQLRSYKVVKAIYPEAHFDSGAASLMFSFGSTDYSNRPLPAYGTAMSFDGGSNYKLDYMQAGRYMSFMVTYDDDSHDFSLTGLDLDFEITGNR